MKFYYIFIFGLYYLIKGSKSHEYYGDVPLDYSMQTLNKFYNKYGEKKIKKPGQHYHPYKQDFTDERAAPTFEERGERTLQASRESISDTIPSLYITSSNHNSSQPHNMPLPHHNNPHVKTKNSSDVSKIYVFDSEKVSRILFNCNLFVSTILNNIISIYKLENIDKIDICSIILSEYYNGFCTSIFDYYLIRIKCQLENKNFLYDDETFEQIEKSSQNNKNISKVFQNIVNTDFENISEKFSLFKSFITNKSLDRKKNIEFLLYKIKTTENGSSLFGPIIPAMFFLYEESNLMIIKKNLSIHSDCFILKIICLIKVVEYAQKQANCDLVVFYNKVRLLIVLFIDSIIKSGYDTKTKENYIIQKANLIERIQEGGYSGPEYIFAQWLSVFFIKPLKGNLKKILQCLENDMNSILHAHQNYIFEILMNVSKLFE